LRLSYLSVGGGIALALLSLTVAPAPAAAGTIYDNSTQLSGGTALVTSADNGPLADSFSTGATDVSLTDVQLLIGADNPSDGGSFTVDLLSDSSTSPGSVLDTIGTINDSSLTTSLGLVDVALTTPYALTADTRYWIELSGDPTSAFWAFTASNTGTGVAGEYNYYAGLVKANDTFTPYQMQVNVSPEPASWTLMIVFGIASGLRLRRFVR
jgi:hypothetical protein